MGNDLRGLFPNSKMAQAKRMGLSDIEESGGTLTTLLTDDFGGIALDVTKWTVIPGGLGLNPNLATLRGDTLAGKGTLTQPAIGSGITGTGGANMSYSVSGSNLVVNMGTTNGEELWFLGNPVLTGKEDILVFLQKSQALAANSIFVGTVEIEPTTGVPIYNPNFALDSNNSGEFANRGGVEFGLTVVNTAYQCEAISDNSSLKAVGSVGTAAAWTSVNECFIEVESHDIIASTCVPDTSSAKLSTTSRVSSQVPNDTKFYKALMRFKNVSAPGSNTVVTIPRALVEDNEEMRVQLTTGEGDLNPQKGVPVNLTGGTLPAAATAATVIGTVLLNSAANVGPATEKHLVSAATTNATSVRATQATLTGGNVLNTTAAAIYLKFFNKASAPTVGTDTPVLTIQVPANGSVPLGAVVGAAGYRFNIGLAFAITGAAADADATAVTAGAAIVDLIYA